MSTEMIVVPTEPTQEMLDAARDWSRTKYGMPIGNDAARGCWKAMTEGAGIKYVARLEELMAALGEIKADTKQVVIGLKEAEARTEALMAAIEYVLQYPSGSGDALVWLREWCEGVPEVMAELTQWIADGKP